MDDLNFLQSSYLQDLSGSNLPEIIIVEDDKLFGMSLKKFLEKKLKLKVHYYNLPSACIDNFLHLNKKKFCLLTDITFDSGTFDGLWLVDYCREKSLDFFSIVMTGHASIETAITATKKGVYHYLTKPFDLDGLLDLLCRGHWEIFKIPSSEFLSEQTVTSPFLERNTYKIEAAKEDDYFCSMIGRSKVMKKVFSRIEKVAQSDSTVLITGPSGTGKELVAKAIHQLSKRKDKNMVCVNCGAIPSELLESELFGHIRGSFTGAISTRKGRFEAANQGTIFLDEIGDMPLLLQVKILRVIQNKQVEMIGGNEVKDVDVRIITATHNDLEQMVESGGFREDLFYRLNVIPIKLPSLKERREDIPLLINYFLTKFVSADGSNGIEFSDKALEILLGHDWPGNVRELENIIERLVILKGGGLVTEKDLPSKLLINRPMDMMNDFHFELPKEGIDLKRAVSEIEDSLILQALSRTNGNKNQASKLLSLNRTTLIEKMKKKEIQF